MNYDRDPDPEWHWKLRVAILVILGHMVILVLPFFSVIFLLMDILGEGSSLGHISGNQYTALLEMGLLILLILTFFLEMVSITLLSGNRHPLTFEKLVAGEVALLGTYLYVSYDAWSPPGVDVPIEVLCFCTVLKISAAVWRERVENVRIAWMKRGPAKIV